MTRSQPIDRAAGLRGDLLKGRCKLLGRGDDTAFAQVSQVETQREVDEGGVALDADPLYDVAVHLGDGLVDLEAPRLKRYIQRRG